MLCLKQFKPKVKVSHSLIKFVRTAVGDKSSTR